MEFFTKIGQHQNQLFVDHILFQCARASSSPVRNDNFFVNFIEIILVKSIQVPRGVSNLDSPQGQQDPQARRDLQASLAASWGSRLPQPSLTLFTASKQGLYTVLM